MIELPLNLTYGTVPYVDSFAVVGLAAELAKSRFESK